MEDEIWGESVRISSDGLVEIENAYAIETRKFGAEYDFTLSNEEDTLFDG